jgi:hypothetical protein
VAYEVKFKNSVPLPPVVNNVVDAETKQREMEALEAAIYERLEKDEADRKAKAEQIAALFGARAEMAQRLETAKPGETFTLSDGTVVHQ